MGSNCNCGMNNYIDNTLGVNTYPCNSNVLGINDTNNCGCNCNGNNNLCGCNNNGGCNCSGNNNSCGCNCNGNNPCGCGRDNENVLGENTTNNNLQENLRNFIGRRCTCEFCLGNNLIKRTGVLSCVGCNFLILSSNNNSNCMICNTDNLKFVTICN